MMLNQKIGFIGCGNMGGGILQGILQKKLASPGQIFVHDPYARNLSRYRVRVVRNNRDVLKSSSIVILAIKPQELANVAKELKAGLTKRHTVISILAGTPVSKIKKHLGKNFTVVRAMPNLGAVVGESMTAVTGDAKGLKKAEVIFSACGKVIRTSEKYLDLVTAVSGSGPAYFFLLMELLASYAKKSGLSEAQANQLAIQTALGSAKLASCAKDSPAVLRARVTSKKGTTDAALKVMFKRKLPKIVEEALKKAVKRAKELSRS